MPFKLFGKLGVGLDWLIRADMLWRILIALGVGKFLQWLITKYTQLPNAVALSLWFIISGTILYIISLGLRKKMNIQQAIVPQGAATDVQKALASTDEFYRLNNGPFLQEVEAHLAKLAGHYKDTAERERFLLRTLSAGGVSYLHDLTWALIYGSQLEALDDLNRHQRMPVEQLRPHYEAAVATYPSVYKRRPYESWLGFLREQNLIRQDDDGQLGVTVRGKDFLKYLVQYGRSSKDRIF